MIKMEDKSNASWALTDLKPRLDDTEVQRVLSLSLFQPASPEAVARVVERCRSSDERKLWGIANGERVVGIVEYYIRDDGILYICNIAVTQERRGQGIGRFMIAALREK
ncbi:MAG: GNAT family N-acetyltransferase, partial [Oscillospiraceae bacterium]|nr:GNAT family N-acetyltransferase [Oscillospiraceae bacterium]